MNSVPPAERRVLCLRDLKALGIEYSNQHLCRLEKAGNFPRRFKLSPIGGRFGAVVWDAQEIAEYLAKRRASSDPNVLLRECAKVAGLSVDEYVERERLRDAAWRKKSAETRKKNREAEAANEASP
jgi:predicted DNA-binding transcriptional regulator AlpA